MWNFRGCNASVVILAGHGIDHSCRVPTRPRFSCSVQLLCASWLKLFTRAILAALNDAKTLSMVARPPVKVVGLACQSKFEGEFNLSSRARVTAIGRVATLEISSVGRYQRKLNLHYNVIAFRSNPDLANEPKSAKESLA